MTHDLVDAAHAYLSAGLRILALTGKTPNSFFHTTWSLEGAIHGVPENAEDSALIERVFTHTTTSGIAIVLHPRLVVVDIDGGAGAEQFNRLTDGKWDRDTAVARTGRGLHLYFLSSRDWGTVKLGPKLDLKGLGGYVAAPPSRHPDGHFYEWLNPLIDSESGGLVNVAWLPEGVEGELRLHARITTAKLPQIDRTQLGVVEFKPTGGMIFGQVPATKNLDGLIEALRKAEEGNGNNLLFWSAASAAEDGFSIEEVFAEFLPVVTEDWERPMEKRTAVGTIRSGFAKVAAHG